jgi:uncharacterized protein YegP (UPF0339 family)
MTTIYIDLYQTPRRLLHRVTRRPQRWRWTARDAGNSEAMGVTSESYTNRQDCIDAIQQLFSDNSNVWMREAEHGNLVLRRAWE